MKGKSRNMGIDVLDVAPWGTHLCQFYRTKQDLFDILVPYFKAGLEGNEFCIWVTSEPIGEKEAQEAMIEAVPDFTQYLRKGQIEIVPYTEWYLKDGVFSAQRVFNAWTDKLDQVLAAGYEGLRVTGNTSWLEEKDWRNFVVYEETLNNTIGNYQIIAICSYSLTRWGTSEIIDVMANHQFALIKHTGKWVLQKAYESQSRKPEAASIRRGRITQQQIRFIRSGFEGFSDQAILKLFLSLCLASREAKKITKKCIAEFKDISEFLAAPPQELERIGICPTAIARIKLLHELPAEVLKKRITEQPFYKSSKEIFDYLYYSIRDLKKEVLKAIYLNSRNQIIDTVDLFEGTLESVPIRPREIVEGAISHGAASIIFVHNHPSADPTPSQSDKQFTRDLVFVGQIIQIKVIDHIIIGGNRYFSFADEGLIEKYGLDFLNFKIRKVLDNGARYSKEPVLVSAGRETRQK
jgi:DNA repair protein RadC